MHSICTILCHIFKFKPFLTSSAIFHAFNDFFELNDLEIKNSTNELWKGWNLAWYHNFTHIPCAKKFRGLPEKLDATSCTDWTISFEVSGFRTKTRLLQRISIFLTYFNSRLFVHSIWTIRSHILKFQPCLTFAIFHAFNELFWAKWPWN